MLLREYGMSVEDYYALLEAQNGVCAICGHKPERGEKLCVDHNHGTSKVRGLLCGTCNSGIGFLRHDLLTLGRAISYLEKVEGKQ